MISDDAGIDPDSLIPGSVEEISYLEAQEAALRQFQQETTQLRGAVRASQAEAPEHSTWIPMSLQDEQLAVALEDSHALFTQQQSATQLATNSSPLDGSWDCPHCTFTNPPHVPQCQACQNVAPDTVLVYPTLDSTNLEFGVEWELVMPGGVRDGWTLSKMAKALTKMAAQEKRQENNNIQVRAVGYSHETTDYWKIVTDSSLQGQDSEGDLCLELVSPILKGEAGLATLRLVMEYTRRLGIDANHTCGFHVHVSAEASSPIGNVKSLRRIAQCYVALENAFDLLVVRSWTANNTASRRRRAHNHRYCQSNRVAFGEKSNHQRWHYLENTSSLAHLARKVSPDRYRKLNFTNLNKVNRPNTIEFRQFGGVQQVSEAEAWIRLVLIFCHRAGLRTGASTACLLPEASTPSEEMQSLFSLLDSPGLQQYFTVERRLFQTQSLKNTWKCRVCRRQFGTSRSLSQHMMAVGHHE